MECRQCAKIRILSICPPTKRLVSKPRHAGAGVPVWKSYYVARRLYRELQALCECVAGVLMVVAVRVVRGRGAGWAGWAVGIGG